MSKYVPGIPLCAYNGGKIPAGRSTLIFIAQCHKDDDGDNRASWSQWQYGSWQTPGRLIIYYLREQINRKTCHHCYIVDKCFCLRVTEQILCEQLNCSSGWQFSSRYRNVLSPGCKCWLSASKCCSPALFVRHTHVQCTRAWAEWVSFWQLQPQLHGGQTAAAQSPDNFYCRWMITREDRAHLMLSRLLSLKSKISQNI